jgi:hypothetical protein
LGCWNGVVRKYANGRPVALNPATAGPERFDEAVAMFAPGARDFRIKLEPEQRLFVVALEPRRAYRVEIEGQRPLDAPADSGGILELHPPAGKEVRVLIR